MPGIGRADPSSELQIAAPNQRADTTDLIDLLCKTFSSGISFRRAWNLTFATIEVDQIPSGPTPGRLHRTRSSTGSELDALYNKENANLTGTAVHPTFPLRNPFVKGDLFVWRQGQELKGYALVSSPGNVLEVKGWVGDPNELLTVVRSLATQRGVKSVQFQWIHCQSELARLLRQKTCAVRTDYRGSGGAMVRVISLQRSLTRLKPELENRLRRSDLSDWCGDLLLDNNREAVTLLINQGDVQVVAASRSKNSMSGGEAIAQLILGTDDPNETVAIGGVKVRGAASALLPVLFPNEYPALGSWDRF